QADLSKFDDVRRVAGDISKAFPKLDVLVNNAGAMFVGRTLSTDGYEMTFALNHLSVFLLTNLLLPQIKAAEAGRIVTVASVAHRGADMDFDDLDGSAGRYSAWRAYQRSKLANVLFTRELASRLEGTGVSANCLHPGFVASKFGENNNPLMTLAMKLGKIFAISPEDGAKTSIYLATADAAQGETGGYFVESKRRSPSRQAQNDKTAKRLWEESAKLVGLPV
ncbi:MAG: SDR family NAD(P)-dependent oxidoreductase, partial [Parvibaculum sp.]